MKRLIVLFALLTILLLLSVSALAQDATATDTDVPAATQEATAAATEEPTSELASATPLPTGTPLPTATDLPTLTPVPDFTPTPLPTDDGDGDTSGGGVDGGSVLLVVIGVLMVFSAGGNVVTMIANFRKDRAATAATEQLGNSIPSQVGDRLLNTIDTLTGLLGIARESLDRVPAAEKPPEKPNLSVVPSLDLRNELIKRGELSAG